MSVDGARPVAGSDRQKPMAKPVMYHRVYFEGEEMTTKRPPNFVRVPPVAAPEQVNYRRVRAERAKDAAKAVVISHVRDNEKAKERG
jgi:hypothetical protein